MGVGCYRDDLSKFWFLEKTLDYWCCSSSDRNTFGMCSVTGEAPKITYLTRTLGFLGYVHRAWHSQPSKPEDRVEWSDAFPPFKWSSDGSKLQCNNIFTFHRVWLFPITNSDQNVGNTSNSMGKMHLWRIVNSCIHPDFSQFSGHQNLDKSPQ